MATISNSDVEALARRLLWDQIDASAWHAGLTDEERTAAIKADVEAWWHLRAGEAAQMLVNRSSQATADGARHPDGCFP